MPKIMHMDKNYSGGGTQLIQRATIEMQNESTISKSGYAAVNSGIDYEDGDIAIVGQMTNYGLTATPYVNASKKWCCMIFCFADTIPSTKAKIKLDILKKL